MVAVLLGADARLRAGVVVPAAVAVVVAWVVLAMATDHSSVSSFAVMWVAMSVAMMIPTVTRPMMRAADGSAARAWTFLGAFLAVWLIAGVPAYLLMSALQWTPFWIALAWIVAGAYQVLPLQHRLVKSCSSVPFTGRAVDYGARQGIRCVTSCAPIMLAAMVTAMALPGFVAPVVVLLGLTALLCWEREPSTPRQAMVVVGMVLILTAVAAVMMFGSGAGHLHG
jgi:predicted metal-binding membrane protein